jgi:hypothetical protein
MLEVLTDIHGVAHDLRLNAMMKKADQDQDEKPMQTHQAPAFIAGRFHAHPQKIPGYASLPACSLG